MNEGTYMGGQSKTRFRINLKDAHTRAGITIYAAARDTGIPYNTVYKYLTEVVVQQYLPGHVLDLVEFFGLNAADPNVIAAIKDEEEGELKAPLAIPA